MFKSIINFKEKLPSNINFHVTNKYHDYPINKKMTNNLSLNNNNNNNNKKKNDNDNNNTTTTTTTNNNNNNQ